MARITMKFGGTSVADLDRLNRVADRVGRAWEDGHELSVALSAMAGETNRLANYVHSIGTLFDAREYDTVVSTGEQVTIGLLALMLNSRGIPARSWLGWQLPILTDNVHSAARIESIDPSPIMDRWQQEDRQVAIVAGFQGMSPRSRISTFGRGGSDLTAVALACALGSSVCQIFTDVDGVYSADPRIVPRAHHIPLIAHEEMLELASVGAKVLHTRAASMAMARGLRIEIRSTFDEELDGRKTMVVPEEEIVEKTLVTGLVLSRDEARVTVANVDDKPGVAASIFRELTDQSINVDMIVQSAAIDANKTDMTFTVDRDDLPKSRQVLEAARERIGFSDLLIDGKLVKVSVVGVGMRSNPGVAQTMFDVLSSHGINMQVISTSEIKISVLIEEDYAELALRSLHSAYGLDVAAESGS